MPRHRKKREPPYWSRRQAVSAVRRVRLSPAVKAPEAGSQQDAPTSPMDVPPATAEPAEASATLPLPAFRRRLLQVASPAGPTALGGTNPAARAARRLMVTPWFAVATGFVVAAGLWIYSPHAELQFPNGQGHEVQCKASGCGHAATNAPNSAAKQAVTSGNAASRIPTRPPRKVTFRLLWRSQGRFFMLVTISGKRVPRTWRLRIDMPGVEITGVVGARWQPTGGSGGTVSWPAANAPGQSAGLGGNGYNNGSLSWYRAGRSFVVVGNGVYVHPELCTFNKATCTFVPAATTDAQGWLSELQNH